MANISKITKKRLGEILIAEGLIHDNQVQEALAEQQKSGLLLGEALIKLGYVTELDIAGALSTQMGLPYINALSYTGNVEIFKLMPVEFWEKNQMAPLDKIGDVVTFTVAGSMSENTLEELEKKIPGEIYFFVSTTSQIKQVIKNYQSPDQEKQMKR
ncbi:MAG: hypothetical protein AAB019_02535 [Planctomycetota bacterium]